MFLIGLGLFFFIELLYFRIAGRFQIMDKPNQRSSHAEVTIRGGGIIFWVAVLFFFIHSRFSYPCFFMGVTAVALISFLDDIYDLPGFYRITIQLTAMVLLLTELNVFGNFHWVYCVLIMIIGAGILNAYNFMDGINGITGGYSLVALTTVFIFNRTLIHFIDDEFLITVISSLLVFNFFNFRKKARCFAGDVGSVTIAMIIIFILLKLSLQKQSFFYIMMLSVYGIDSVWTSILRLANHENIFLAHRSHLYQLLVAKGQPHLLVSIAYMCVQAAINGIVFTYANDAIKTQWLVSLIIIIFLTIVWFIGRKFCGFTHSNVPGAPAKSRAK